MKKIILLVLVLLTAVSFAFSSTAPSWAAGDIIDDENFYYFVGTGTSKNFKIALKKAQADARTKVAEYINKKVEEVVNDYVNESGDHLGSQLSESFESLSVQRTSATIKGMRVVQWYKSDDSNDVWVLMKVDKKYLDEQLDASISTPLNTDILSFGKQALLKQIEDERVTEDTKQNSSTNIKNEAKKDKRSERSTKEVKKRPFSAKIQNEVVEDEDDESKFQNMVEKNIIPTLKNVKSSITLPENEEGVSKNNESEARSVTLDNRDADKPTKINVAIENDNSPIRENISGTIELQKTIEKIK